MQCLRGAITEIKPGSGTQEELICVHEGQNEEQYTDVREEESRFSWWGMRGNPAQLSEAEAPGLTQGQFSNFY